MDCSHQKHCDGVCLECGMEINEEIRHVLSPKKGKNLIEKLKQFDIDSDLNDELIKVFMSEGKNYRGRNFSIQTFAAAYRILTDQNKTFDPKVLAQQFQLSQKEVNTAMKLIGRYQSQIVIFHPSFYSETISASLRDCYKIDSNDLKTYIEDKVQNDEIKCPYSMALKLTYDFLIEQKPTPDEYIKIANWKETTISPKRKEVNTK